MGADAVCPPCVPVINWFPVTGLIPILLSFPLSAYPYQNITYCPLPCTFFAAHALPCLCRALPSHQLGTWSSPITSSKETHHTRTTNHATRATALNQVSTKRGVLQFCQPVCQLLIKREARGAKRRVLSIYPRLGHPTPSQIPPCHQPTRLLPFSSPPRSFSPPSPTLSAKQRTGRRKIQRETPASQPPLPAPPAVWQLGEHFWSLRVSERNPE